MDLLRALFEENFTRFGELGASVSVWQHGRELLNLGAGFCDRQKTQPWTSNTPVLIWSATKGLAAASVLHACAQARLPLETRVARLWPEFAAEGKGEVTFAQVLSHQAGLSALGQKAAALDHSAVAAALAAEPPHWALGTGHGYHPRTFGYLLDELLRRITGGMSLSEYWRQQFAEPLGLDLWIGIPPERVDEVAPMFPAKNSPPKGDAFYTAFLTPGSLTARAFSSPHGLHSVAAMNSPEARTAAIPAFGGIGTASALAKFYAMLAQGGVFEGRTYFDSLAPMTRTLAQGPDKVLLLETAFSAGFMRDPVGPDGAKQRQTFGPSPSAFGHPGAGGSHAFADPDTGISFAYVMNQMEPGVLPNAKSLRLVEALYGLLR
jgi:CubicO group peptidase (beta-lactamase class C family)